MQMDRHSTFDPLCVALLQKIHDQDMVLICIFGDHIQIKVQCKGLFDRLRQHRHKTTDKFIVGSLKDRTVKITLRLDPLLAGRILLQMSLAFLSQSQISSSVARLHASAAASGSKIIRVS